MMLDTNIVSDLVRNPHGRAAIRLMRHGEDGICVSVITTAELRFGIAKGGSARLAQQVERVLATVDVVAFDMPADIQYGELRAHLAKAGTPIGSVDLFIAAHALALDVTLVTHNVAEFSRVPGLAVEDWLV